MSTQPKAKLATLGRGPRNFDILRLEGTYTEIRHTAVQLTLKRGEHRWGQEIGGKYTATMIDEFSCRVRMVFAMFGCSETWEYLVTRRGKTYTFEETPNGGKRKFKRDDGAIFLADSRGRRQQAKALPSTRKKRQALLQLRNTDTKVTFYLTGESVVTAATIPTPPSAKGPTIIRVTHSNPIGRVDSDIFVRLGDPKRPLGVKDFNTVSDWRKASLVEDLLWNDERNEWELRGKARGLGSNWIGTYETEIRFGKGQHQIELKVVSRVPEVCSIVLSNWKSYVR
jgi:hypothetical protein